MKRLPPGSTIGIVGGGQLGRMLSMAAAQLGYRTHIFAPKPDSVAAEVSAGFTCAPYEDAAAQAAFADAVDVVTYEFENIATGPIEAIAERCPVFPPVAALETAQDRLIEKRFVRDLGVRTAPFAAVDSRADLDAALAEIGTPAILKTRRFGYDGKGQARILNAADADAAWDAIGGQPAILEGFVLFEREYSLLLVRGQNGESRFWNVPDNEHEEGILARSIVPASGIVAAQADEAARLAIGIADALDYVGVLAVEFFASAQGPVFNEMAPRVHNSGHWTIEGAVISQFENHIRAVCGLPLGDTSLAAARVEMRNLIGAEVDAWPELLADPANHLHLYGKGEAHPGRKMGHVTKLFFA